jgi:hypothetical protein
VLLYYETNGLKLPGTGACGKKVGA